MSSLPAQPGPLIGREAEVSLTCERLLRDDIRLLSLIGPAGTGKTRLAIEVAGRVASSFADGICFVDLAPISDPALLSTAIAQALVIREERDRPLLHVLKDALAEQHVLLLLDNFEQLLPAATQLTDLLQACPGLKLLTTSRSALRLSWENVIRVPPLETPGPASSRRSEAIAEVAAVTLFVQRAQRVNPHFTLSDSNARAVADICIRLDGLPLAIELAAARTRVLPPEALLDRLRHRLTVLQGASQDQPPRQRTLRAALDWSYDLLSPAERALFRQLGVFVGGFPLSAVNEVCDHDGGHGMDVLAGVESLVDKSLLRQEAASAEGHEPRFGMLETIREYALEQLSASGEADRVRRAHAVYYLGGADIPVAEMRFSQQSIWLKSLDAEHDNIRTALEWCREAREPKLGLSAAGLLSWFWIVRGYVAEGRRQLNDLLVLAGPARTGFRAEALRVIGSLALHQADYAAARELFDESLAIRRELDDPAGMLGPLSSLGAVLMQQGDYAAAEGYFNEALAITEAIGDALGTTETLNNLANVAHERGQLDRARALYEKSLAMNPPLRYRTDVPLHNLAVVAQEQGDLTTARQLLRDSVALKRALGDSAGLALSLAKLGEVVASTGDLGQAHHLLAESLQLERDLGDRTGMAFVLERFAMTAAAHGQPERALRLGGAAQALRARIGTPLGVAARQSFENALERARLSLPSEVGDAAWSVGLQLQLDQAVTEALTVEPRLVSDRRRADPASQLSGREKEVAILIAQGLTNRDIADRLVVSERTAENHVQRVMNRLGLRSRAHVAAWAVHHGLTDSA